MSLERNAKVELDRICLKYIYEYDYLYEYRIITALYRKTLVASYRLNHFIETALL